MLCFLVEGWPRRAVKCKREKEGKIRKDTDRQRGRQVDNKGERQTDRLTDWMAKCLTD